jgi:hypothetical protein
MGFDLSDPSAVADALLDVLEYAGNIEGRLNAVASRPPQIIREVAPATEPTRWEYRQFYGAELLTRLNDPGDRWEFATPLTSGGSRDDGHEAIWFSAILRREVKS